MKQLTTYEDIRDFLVKEKGVTIGFRIESLKEQIDLPDTIKKEVTQWIKDLESGKYRQARELLYDSEEDGYCCLGVALIDHVPKEELRQMGVPSDLNNYKANDIDNHVVMDMVTLTKANDETGWYTKALENSLTSFNDEYLLNFDEIAMILRYKFKIYE